MIKTEKKYYLYICTISLLIACTEPFIVENLSSETAIVVEATITNEFKYQKILLSNTLNLSENRNEPETNANIYIKDENNNIFNFKEVSSGEYISFVKFKAEFDVNYQIFITTSNGVMYESKPTKTSSQSKIEDIKVNLHKNLEGKNEFRIFVESLDNTGKSKYYRYEYEETYKIVAPYWDSLEAVLLPTTPIKTIKIEKKSNFNQEVCYQTKKSNTIIQTSTTDLDKDKVTFAVRRIPVDNPIVSHRYSILVKQYVQSLESYTYYSLLNKFTNSSNVLSQSQPGFISSNIYNPASKNDKVLGYFEVVSVSSKRMFFNRKDYFSATNLSYPEKCGFFAPTSTPNEQRNSTELVDAIESGDWIYFSNNDNPNKQFPGPYILTLKDCGDCTKFGTNVKPSFWVE